MSSEMMRKAATGRALAREYAERQTKGSGDGATSERKVIELADQEPKPRTHYVQPEYQPPKQELPPEILDGIKARALTQAQTGRELLGTAGAPVSGEIALPTELTARATQPAQTLVFKHAKNTTGIADSYENALSAILGLRISCQYDEFHDKHVILDCRGEPIGNGLDNAALKIRKALLHHYGAEFKKNNVLDTIEALCDANRFNPVFDYLERLRWDGTRRIDRWLIDYCGVEDRPLNRAIGRKMLIAAVRRVRVPGCKFDYILVLEGSQGAGKSSLLRILAGDENFSDAEILGMDKQEQQEATAGIWIYELAELVGLSKADMNKVKHFASKQVDMARPAYGRARVDKPRTCIFVATTNDKNYLRDPTGNRRFWPVEVGGIDLEAAAADRDQLWAEAAAAEAMGEALVIPPELWGDAAAAAEARMEIDPWMEVIAARLELLEEKGKTLDGKYSLMTDDRGEPEWRISSEWLMSEVLKIPKERQTIAVAKNLVGIMRRLRWEYNDKTMKIGKLPNRGYRKAVAAVEAE